MVRPLVALFLLTSSTLAAEGPDAVKSAAAVAALRADSAAMDVDAVPLTKANAAAARELLWKAHVEAIKKDRAAELKAGKLTDGKLVMPIFTKTFGEKPKDGRSLWISMHGGGNAPANVNDKQWENQKKLYTVAEGVYVAPRAPTNTWNLWHEAHIDRLFGRLIEDMVVLEGVDPNRVYVLGYSAGGDGVYQIAPRLADRWAAAAMMAGHPNDASPLNLRNVPFALQCGGKDAAFNRNKVAAEWGEKLAQLRKDDPGGYELFLKIYPDKAHWMGGEDKVALPWMAKHTRNPVPDRVVWRVSGVHERSYWLAVPSGGAKQGAVVVVERKGQAFDIVSAEGFTNLLVRLDDRMTDLDKPVKVTHKGKVLFEGPAARTIGTMRKTLAGRGDPQLVFDAEVSVMLK